MRGVMGEYTHLDTHLNYRKREAKFGADHTCSHPLPQT